jgi:hypothetical protein
VITRHNSVYGKRASAQKLSGAMPLECLTTFFMVNGHVSQIIKAGANMTVKKNVKKAAGGRIEWLGSYNYYLTTADKAGIKKLSIKSDDVLARFQELVDSGYKVSVTLDSEERFYTVTAFASQRTSPNAGYSMSLRHSDSLVAINALWHVVATVMTWERWENLGQDELPFNW